MSKYDQLGTHLRGQGLAEVRMSFADIERVVGTKLPKSQEYPAWWSNSTSNNVMTKVWLDAGYRTEQVDTVGKKLVFKRVAKDVRVPSLSDATREFKPAETGERKPRRSPLFGALKGTFTIDASWDVAKPALDPDELAEMFANIERTANLIEAGLSGKRR